MTNYQGFLKELSELSKKHKIFIGGCGCCDSPWLSTVKNERGHYTTQVDNHQNHGFLTWEEERSEP